MKKHLHKWAVAVLMLTLFFCQSVQAKTTNVSETAITDVRKAPEVTGKWQKEGSQFKLLLPDGTYQKSGWIKRKGNVYYLDEDGCRVTGWILYRNAYYYARRDGRLAKGWLNHTYYLKKNYTRAKGLTTVDGEKYYFDSKNGKKRTGWIQIGRKTYNFANETGVMLTKKWIRYKDSYRYVDENGVMIRNNWVSVKGKTYYLNDEGIRVTGEQYIDGKWYYFSKRGVYDPEVVIDSTVDPSKKMVALTFDDGPGPYTSKLLKCLNENHAKATFFMVGSSVSRYQDVVKQMAEQGCELGNHSYSHPVLPNLSTSGIQSEINRTSSKIKEASGKMPTVARLPYGSGHNNSRVLNAIGLPSIYWSIDTRDWANTGNSAHTVNAVLNSVRDGDIVLMHDIHYATLQANLSIIPALRKRGFQMVTVSELAKYKGKQSLKSGKTYYNFY